MQSMHRVESKCFLLTLYGVTGKQFYSRNACAQLAHRSHLKFLLRFKNFPAQPSQSTRWIAVRLVFLWRRPADSRVSWSLVSNFSVMIVAFKIFSSRGSPLVRRFSSTIVFNSLMVVVAVAVTCSKLPSKVLSVRMVLSGSLGGIGVLSFYACGAFVCVDGVGLIVLFHVFCLVWCFDVALLVRCGDDLG